LRWCCDGAEQLDLGETGGPDANTNSQTWSKISFLKAWELSGAMTLCISTATRSGKVLHDFTSSLNKAFKARICRMTRSSRSRRGGFEPGAGSGEGGREEAEL